MEITFYDGDKSYTISVREGDREYPLMLTNESGEGMSCSSKNIFDVLDDYFKREF